MLEQHPGRFLFFAILHFVVVCTYICLPVRTMTVSHNHHLLLVTVFALALLEPQANALVVPTVACVRNGTLAADSFFLNTRSGFETNAEVGTSWLQHAGCAPTNATLDRSGSNHLWAVQWGNVYFYQGDANNCGARWQPTPPQPANATMASGSGAVAVMLDIQGGLHQLLGISVSSLGGTLWATVSLPEGSPAAAFSINSAQDIFVAIGTGKVYHGSASDNFTNFTELAAPGGALTHLACNRNTVLGVTSAGALLALPATQAMAPRWTSLTNATTSIATVDVDELGTVWASTPSGAVLRLAAGGSATDWVTVSLPAELVCAQVGLPRSHSTSIRYCCSRLFPQCLPHYFCSNHGPQRNVTYATFLRTRPTLDDRSRLRCQPQRRKIISFPNQAA